MKWIDHLKNFPCLVAGGELFCQFPDEMFNDA